MISQVTIERFRGIREGTLSDLAQINVLIGRNGCGKSTVCEAIARSIAHHHNPIDPLGRLVDAVWSNARNEPSMAQSWWFANDYTQTMSTRISLDDGELFGFQRTADASSRLASANEAGLPTGCATFRPGDGLNKTIELNAWASLLRTRGDAALVDTLNKVFDLGLVGLQLPPDGTMIGLYPTLGLPIDTQGEGIRTALRCLIFLGQLRGWAINLEEPECHQHPGSLKKLAKAVCLQASTLNQQLFVTTHSETCIDAFLDGADEAKLSAAVYHLALDQAGTLAVRRLAPEVVRGLDETGTDVRFLDLYA